MESPHAHSLLYIEELETDSYSGHSSLNPHWQGSNGFDYDIFSSPIDDAPFLISSDSEDDDDIPHIPEDVLDYEEEFIRDLWRAESKARVDSDFQIASLSFLDTIRDYQKSEDEHDMTMDMGEYIQRLYVLNVPNGHFVQGISRMSWECPSQWCCITTLVMAGCDLYRWCA